MTMLAHSTAQHETPGVIDFAPDMLVVRDVDVSGPANEGRVSRFSEESWFLYPAAHKPTARTSVYFGSSPPEFRDALKRLVYCAVNLDTPMDELGRPPHTVLRLSVSSVAGHLTSSWRPFVRWLAEQGIGSISEADADMLTNYREHVAELPISPKSKDLRMLGLWRMWRYAPCLPAGDRLMQPPWEAANHENDISDWDSPRESRSENRTPPILPETMAALLVWSMRFVNDFSSDILRARQRRTDMDANIRQRRRGDDLQRWNRYLNGLRHDREPLPGLHPRQWRYGTRCELSRGKTRRQLFHYPSPPSERHRDPGWRAAGCRDQGADRRRAVGCRDRLLRGRRLGAAPHHRLRGGDRLPLGHAPRGMPRAQARLLPAVRSVRRTVELRGPGPHIQEAGRRRRTPSGAAWSAATRGTSSNRSPEPWKSWSNCTPTNCCFP